MASVEGIDLLRRLNDGQLTVAPSEYLIQTREDVSTAIEELIEVGARIRPLIVEHKKVGWVRGVHLSERKALKRWISDEVEFIEHLLLLATTLTLDEIRDLSLTELRSLSRVVSEMTESDLRLYSFVSAFVSTSLSEQLWFSRATEPTTFRDRVVSLPDGKQIKLALPSDQARLWATLCNYRLEAKRRLEASTNAVLTIRPHVGKGADPISADLKRIALSLATDSLEPWRDSVKFTKDVNVEDGWAHSEDDSREGILRELKRMASNDLHEQVFAQVDKQHIAEAEARQAAIDTQTSARGGRGYIDYKTIPMTEKQVRERSAALKLSRPTLSVPAEQGQSSVMDRLAKYR